MKIPSPLKKYGTLFIALAAATGYFLFAPHSDTLHYNFTAESYIVLHSVLEAVSIIIAFMCFGITFHSHGQAKNDQNLFLGTAFLALAIIDTAHMLSYEGMPDLITPNTVNKAAQLWVTARLLGSLTFLAAAFVPPDPERSGLKLYTLAVPALLTGFGVVSWVILFPESVPTMFEPGKGLTPLKVSLEYIIVALMALAAALFLRLYIMTREGHLFYFIGAMALSVFSELFFTLYASPYDIYNLMGHVYKVGTYFFIYQMLFVTSVKRPYDELSVKKQELREYTHKLEEIVEDRTRDLAEKNSELERLNKLKTDFLAMCSHDMKSPLQSSMLILDVLLAEAEGKLTDEQRKSLETIRKNEEAQLGLVKNLLDLARHEQGEMRLNVSTVDFGSLLKSWVSGQMLLAEKKQLRLSFEDKDVKGPLLLGIDVFKMTQVLNNLMSNALKFTPSGGEIRLSVREAADGGAEVRLFNSGPAIRKERLYDIFEKYVTMPDGGSGAEEGHGLGLSIVKGIVELHGGSIWAESEEGSGSTFTFTVPPRPPLQQGG